MCQLIKNMYVIKYHIISSSNANLFQETTSETLKACIRQLKNLENNLFLNPSLKLELCNLISALYGYLIAPPPIESPYHSFFIASYQAIITSIIGGCL